MLKLPPKVQSLRRPASEEHPHPCPVQASATHGLIPFAGPELSIAQPEKNGQAIEILTHSRSSFASRLPAFIEFVQTSSPLVPLSRHPAWLNILDDALGHEPFAVEATLGGRTVGYLPLTFLDSMLFGRFLVSLPYLNTSGVLAPDPAVQERLISRAITLADELNARHLELRHERAIPHAGLSAQITSKVHMRLGLPPAGELLWKEFDPKVRNQIRKGEKHGFEVVWGGTDQLDAFYDVLCRNMRDLGTPVFGIELFRQIVSRFGKDAEFCVVKDKKTPVAAAMLLHGRGVTEVPSASSLREYNPTSVNMLMYWHLLQRSLERGQKVFDFGRSTTDGNTFRFKKQWGAEPEPAVWQYRVNSGEAGDMRPDNPRYQLAIRLWQRLPLSITRFLGPRIVRGIP